MAVVRLSIDFENSASHWWSSGGRDLWASICQDFDDNSVVFDAELAKSWLAQAARIPGWDDGPEYAPHPIAVTPVEDDEER